ncbi:RNA polymerase sigma factor [Streptomyces sp. NPDC060002]|uniref:RNA polymerase sigma factor n=1 Tax=Streptomyces sp. NPDC060002 TaxID=3347033 RepID=UPI0036ABFDC6
MGRPGSDEFRAIYAKHYNAVLRYAWRRVGADAAPDVAAEVFTVVWRRLDQVPTNMVLPWLYGVARKVVSSHVRGTERTEHLAGQWDGQAAVSRDVADQVTVRHEVRRAWLSLGESDREVLALIGWEGLNVREAARVAGCTAATFSVRLHRARSRLRHALSRAEATTTPSLKTVNLEDTQCA